MLLVFTAHNYKQYFSMFTAAKINCSVIHHKSMFFTVSSKRMRGVGFLSLCEELLNSALPSVEWMTHNLVSSGTWTLMPEATSTEFVWPLHFWISSQKIQTSTLMALSLVSLDRLAEVFIHIWKLNTVWNGHCVSSHRIHRVFSN
jgi:hypothetical protein